MQLLLTSAGFNNPKIGELFVSLLGVPPGEAFVVLIPTAGRNDEGEYSEYIDLSRKQLVALGIGEVKTVEILEGFDEADIARAHALFICGGNTFSLMRAIRETRFDLLITKFVQRGGLYTGVSAGSIIPRPSIELAGMGSEGDENDVELADLRGLGLVPFAVFPHYRDALAEEVRSLADTLPYPVIPLTDNQALLVHDDAYLRIG